MFEDLPEYSENYYKRVQLLTHTSERSHDAVVVHTPPVVTININYLHIAKIVISVNIYTEEVTSNIDKIKGDDKLLIKCSNIVRQYTRFVHDAFHFSALRNNI